MVIAKVEGGHFGDDKSAHHAVLGSILDHGIVHALAEDAGKDWTVTEEPFNSIHRRHRQGLAVDPSEAIQRGRLLSSVGQDFGWAAQENRGPSSDGLTSGHSRDAFVSSGRLLARDDGQVLNVSADFDFVLGAARPEDDLVPDVDGLWVGVDLADQGHGVPLVRGDVCWTGCEPGSVCNGRQEI